MLHRGQGMPASPHSQALGLVGCDSQTHSAERCGFVVSSSSTSLTASSTENERGLLEQRALVIGLPSRVPDSPYCTIAVMTSSMAKPVRHPTAGESWKRLSVQIG